MSQDKGLVELIGMAARMGAPIAFTEIGTVGGSSENSCSVTTESGETMDNVRWTYPGQPRTGARVLLTYPKNNDQRPVAHSFESLEKLYLEIGEKRPDQFRLF